MTTRAVIVGPIRRGAATPPAPPADLCGWDEGFDQADFAAFRAQYEFFGTGEFFSVNPDPPGSAITVAGSRLLLAGDGGAFGSIQFNRVPASSGYLNAWVKIEGEMLGGAYVPNTASSYSADAVGLALYHDPGFGTVVDIDNTTSYGILIDGPVAGVIHTSDTTHPPTNFPSGLWAVYICLSYSGTALTVEYWINPAPGDAADYTLTHTDIVDVINATSVEFFNPVTLGTTLAVDRVRVVCGTRASDPFGIL